MPNTSSRYRGMHIYQFKENDFQIEFWIKSSCLTAWMHMNSEFKKCCQLKTSLWLLINLDPKEAS